MAKLTIVTREGVQQDVDVDASTGHSLMEIIRDRGFDELEATCGGCCSCATCHVLVDPDWFSRLPEMSEDENDLLDGTGDRHDNSRLSCQIEFAPHMDGLKVTIAPW